jgi:5-methyltetrahydrofolate--homocysteine methyltransferase
VDPLSELRTRTLVFDGAMGSMLIAAGYRPVEAPETWNVSAPDKVAAIHRAYLQAGADFIETNSFGGSRAKLAAYGAGERATELNTAGARLACAVRDEVAPDRLVAGDVGPSGRLLPPLGDADPGELRDVFAEQAAALVAGGVDLIAMTTFFDIEEARAAVLAAREAAGSRPVFCSMAFRPSPRGYRTMMGVTPAQAAAALLEAGADVVGANCEITADAMPALIAEFRAATDAPLIAQPNAGKPRLDGETTVYEETPERFAGLAPAIVAAGANVVGGCCGTTPAFVAALVAALRA